MPIQKAPNEKELEKLIAIFLRAETDIINEISRLRSQGLVDYHAVAALNRIQEILKQMETDCWEYVPKMIEQQFYVRVPEARKILEPVEKHIRGYENAEVLTATQHSIIDRLVTNLMGEIVEASGTTQNTLQNAIIGRTQGDIFRRVSLGTIAQTQAMGKGVKKTANDIFQALARGGVTAFVDKAGRKWSLHTYCSMVARTTSRQAEVLATLTADENHDLYQISSHGTTCKICAPLEGRVYSKSGKDLDFPPLASAFGKIDPNGPDDLTNSYLNIHPNCLHVLIPWSAAGRSDEEIQRIKDFSSFKKNPPTKDPRTQQQIEAYRKKETARANWLRDYRQWENYRMSLGEQVPQNFETFQKHKRLGDERFKKWKAQYKINSLLTEEERYAINQYISSASYFLNELLRYEMKLTEEQKAITINLDQALQKLPKYQGSVTRSVDFISEENKQVFLQQHHVGKVVVYPQYTSTTKGNIYNPDADIQIIIENSTRGKDLKGFNDAEKEVLYERNAKFVVLDNFEKNGKYIIIMKEV